MALLFVDSHDHYGTGQVSEKYTSVGFGSSIVAGRHGNGISAPDISLGFNNPLVASTRFILGVAVYPSFNNGTIMGVRDIHSDICSLGITTSGTLGISIFGYGANGEDTTHLYSAPDVIRINRWSYVEFQGDLTQRDQAPYIVREIHDLRVWVDGDLVLTPAGYCGENVIELPGQMSTYYWNTAYRGDNFGGQIQDDFYALDGSGPAPWNAPLGDVEIGVIRPNGVGPITEWTPNGLGANWTKVDDQTPDNESTYNSAATAGLKDIYEMEDVDPTQEIIGAQMLVSSRRIDDGYASLTPIIKHDGVEYDGQTRSLTNTYFYRNRDVYPTAPDGTDWTVAKLNAIKAGFRRET